MNYRQEKQLGSLFGGVVAVSVCIWLYTISQPLFSMGQLQVVPAVACLLGVMSLCRVLQHLFALLAYAVDWFGARTPTGKHGTARWAKFRDLKTELNRKRSAPFWGLLARSKKALFIDFASNALCVGPAGSGKGTTSVVPCAMSVRASKVIADFKGELVCMLKDPLEKRDEKVFVINPGGLWSERVDKSDSLNPVDLIVDDLHRPGGLRDVFDDLREQMAQILPEPNDSEGENTYFREGGRRIGAFAMLSEAMVDEYEATLSSVALLIEDRQRLEHTARWIAGVDLEGQPLPEGPMPIEQAEWASRHDPQDVIEFAQVVRAQATNLVALMSSDDNRTFESFITGIQQALAPFAFGRLAPAMGRSTFNPDELKRRTTTLFLVADASRMDAYKPFLGLMQWCILTKLKRHESKDVPVYFLMDEASNYKIFGLDSLLTWGRSYGLRLLLWLQDLQAFERVYGRTVLDTLLSETEIKLFLPGQRNPKTLELLAKKMLGEQSIMAANVSQRGRSPLQESFSEAGRRLMDTDEIRQTDYGLLFVRRTPPVLIDPISYAEISPWRKQVGVNPFHGKPYLKKIKLRLKS